MNSLSFIFDEDSMSIESSLTKDQMFSILKKINDNSILKEILTKLEKDNSSFFDELSTLVLNTFVDNTLNQTVMPVVMLNENNNLGRS